jgi:ribosomal protein S18 acetylase RimI-like enzyme
MGIGTRLIRELLKWFKKKGLRNAEVLTLSRNRKVIRLYGKLGFREIHRKYTLKIR